MLLQGSGPAKRFSHEITSFANKKWQNGAQMSALIASLILQNIVLSLAHQLYPRGSKLVEGAQTPEDFIANVVDGTKRDALEKWQILRPNG